MFKISSIRSKKSVTRKTRRLNTTLAPVQPKTPKETQTFKTFAQVDNCLSSHYCTLPHTDEEEQSRINRGGMVLLGKYKLPMNAYHYLDPRHHPLAFRWRPPQDLVDALISGKDLIHYRSQSDLNHPIPIGYIAAVNEHGDIICGNYSGFFHHFNIPVDNKAYYGKLIETYEEDASIKGLADLQSEKDEQLFTYLSTRLYFLGTLAKHLGGLSKIYTQETILCQTYRP